MIVTNAKFARGAGHALGSIIDDAEYEAWKAEHVAKLDAEYDRVISQGNSNGGNMRVAFRNCHVGSRTIMRGETFYVSRVTRSLADYRLQSLKQGHTTFATMSLAQLDSFSTPVPKAEA